jgi:stearoyl-CoA desaturase (delta-9 desaturase)
MQTVPAVAVAGPIVPAVGFLRAVRIALSLTPLMAVHLALIAIPWIEWSWWYLLWIVVLTRIAGFGVSAGLHRYCSHRAFKTSRTVQFLLAAAGCTALQKGPLWWSVHHRLHHKHSDEPGDPHSPVQDGFLYGHVGWLFSQDLMHPDESVVHDLRKYRELIWLDRLWMVPGLLLAAACFALGGWGGLVFGYCLSVVFVFQVTFAVNSVGHLFGPQRFETGDGSRNNPVLGILAMGDGWHNNHHRAPSSARHGFAWYELDMSYVFLRMMERIGLVWDLKQPPEDLRRMPAQFVVAAVDRSDSTGS